MPLPEDLREALTQVDDSSHPAKVDLLLRVIRLSSFRGPLADVLETLEKSTAEEGGRILEHLFHLSHQREESPHGGAIAYLAMTLYFRYQGDWRAMLKAIQPEPLR